jgi:hypothetical protein
MKLLLANLAIDLAKYCAEKMGKPELANTKKSHSVQELGRFAATVSNTQLEKIGVPIRFKGLLGKLGQNLEGRDSAVHESSYELARLLMLPASQQTYLRHQGLYRVIYGETIEERAEGGVILDELL